MKALPKCKTSLPVLTRCWQPPVCNSTVKIRVTIAVTIKVRVHILWSLFLWLLIVHVHVVLLLHDCSVMLRNYTACLCSARRKLKWSVDPRNSAWSNDDSKFGQKMLERMGWSKGKVSVQMDPDCVMLGQLQSSFLDTGWHWINQFLNLSVTCYSFIFHVKGLGRSGQGATDHIKVKVKNDSYGLGANASYEVRTFYICLIHPVLH